jgi:predicted NBD/HSP70 family sugar kinase
MSQGSNSSTLRQYNERIVISVLRKTGAASKADLSRHMGLTLPAMTRIVDELEARGLIEKSGRRSQGVGQPSHLYQINENGLFSIGVKLGRQNIELVLANFAGDLLAKTARDYQSPSPNDLLNLIEHEVSLLIKKLTPTQSARFTGVGIAMPWFIGKWVAQHEMSDQQAREWRDFDFASELDARIQYPIFFENDCSAAAAAEMHFGKYPNLQNFLYIYVGTLIGGGLILNGDLERGIHSNAACLATLPVPCSTLDSAGADKNWGTLVNRASITTLLNHLQYHQVTIDHISELPTIIDQHRALVHDWMVDCADSLLYGILASISFLDLEAVVIDSELPGYLLSELISMVQRRLDALTQENLFIPKLHQGSLGEDAIAIGGAILPLYSHFAPDRTVLLKGGIPDRQSNLKFI